MRLLLLIAIAMVAFAFPALAQEAAAAPDTTIRPFSVLYQYIEPAILSAVGIVVTVLLSRATALFNKWTGVNIDAKYADRIHTAVMTGVSAGLARAGVAAADFKIDVHNQVIADAVRWAEDKVPDALNGLGIGAGDLKNLALSKITLLAETGTTPLRAGSTSLGAIERTHL